tara:strand:+ start:9052 stop:9276 length:225 start_codon:yes stop_codon:yes gene_type:complete
MPGHDLLAGLGSNQAGAAGFEGKFIKIKAGAVSGDNGESGFGRGALGVDTTNGKLYINTGTFGSATWIVVGTQS